MQISKAFEEIYSKEFQKKLKNVENPYGENCPSNQIVEVLKNVNLANILKKSFYDLRG